MSFGERDDDDVLRLLATGQYTTTTIAKHLKVDDGTLAVRLHKLSIGDVKLIRICDVKGSTPVWELTDAGRTRADQLRGRRSR